jgi:hypothetical protein
LIAARFLGDLSTTGSAVSSDVRGNRVGVAVWSACSGRRALTHLLAVLVTGERLGELAAVNDAVWGFRAAVSTIDVLSRFVSPSRRTEPHLFAVLASGQRFSWLLDGRGPADIVGTG